MLSLVVSFVVIAFLYAIVGFGGGSSYTALLALAETPYVLIPKISLLCNLLVVSGGCYQFWKRRHIPIEIAAPLVLSSVPFAFLGGVYPLREQTFMILLTSTLFLAGLRVLFIKNGEDDAVVVRPIGVSIIVGGLLGLLSGMVGIGGGIFLSPLMLNLKWAKAKEVAAVASWFIFLNSIAGIAGQMMKDPTFPHFERYAPLFLAVIAGGQLGSRVGTHPKISHRFIQRGTGILILFVSGRLFLKSLAD